MEFKFTCGIYFFTQAIPYVLPKNKLSKINKCFPLEIGTVQC